MYFLPMLCRPLLSGFAVVLCAAILAGCVSPPGDAARPVPSGSRSHESEEDMKRRASAHAHYANGVILEVQHHRAQSLVAFREAALLVPEDEELVWEASRRFIAARESDGAIELLSLSAARPDASGLTWARLAAIQLQAGDSAAAIKAGQSAIERDPAVVQGHQSVFLAHLQEGDLELAQTVLEEAEPYGVADPAFLVQLSELYSLLSVHKPGQREAIHAIMLRLLESAAALPIHEDMLRVRVADGFASLGWNDRAAELYQELLETMADSPGARDIIRSKLTEAYLRGKDPLQAREQLETLLKRDPTNVRVCYLLGSLAYDTRDFETARDYFERVIVLRPAWEQAYYDLAGILLNLDLTEEADEVVATARAKFPQSFAMEMLSALVHMRRGENATAIGHFSTAEITAQAMNPERLTHFFYFQYGAASEQAGEFAAAERHLKKSLELDPDFAPSQNYLGYMWADRGEHLGEALELIQRATRSDPENAAYLDSLAWVLFKLDRLEEALTEIRKAIECLEESDSTVYDHLGDIHARLEEWEEAIAAWQQSYTIDPTDEVRDKLEAAGQAVPAPIEEGSTHE